jgi:uncharacterized protein YjbI with pentapeptide repeats
MIMTTAGLADRLVQHRRYLDSVGAEGQQLELDGDDLRGADLAGQDLTEAVLAGVDLTDADLRGATLDSVWLAGSVLTRARFDGTSLVKADLSGVDAQEASFDESDLTRTDFTGADLGRASFRRSWLRRTSFADADLRDARFVEAVVAGAHLDGAQVAGWDATGLTGTLLARTVHLTSTNGPTAISGPEFLAWLREGGSGEVQLFDPAVNGEYTRSLTWPWRDTAAP